MFNNLRDEVTAQIFVVLTTAAISASDGALDIARSWGRTTAKGGMGIPWQTYKAIVKREGSYSNRTRAFNFNADLAQPFMEPLDKNWDDVFNQQTEMHLESTVSTCELVADEFRKAFLEHMRLKGCSEVDMTTFMGQLERFLNYVRRSLREAGTTINSKQKTINRVPEEHVSAKLKPIYQAASRESGAGMYGRMRDLVEGAINHERRSIFNQANEKVQHGIEEFLTEGEGTVKLKLERCCDSLGQDCHHFVSLEERTFFHLADDEQREILLRMEEVEDVLKRLSEGEQQTNNMADVSTGDSANDNLEGDDMLDDCWQDEQKDSEGDDPVYDGRD